MTKYTQEEMDRLISCPKIITGPPKKNLKLNRGSKHNNMKLQSKDGKDNFSVFMRVNERFPEIFSVGLMYHPQNDPTPITLLRCNGNHGEHRNHAVGAQPFTGFHIHKATVEAIETGELPEQFAEPTDAYAGYEEALIYFMKITNIQNPEQHFANIYNKQLSLFEELEDNL